MHNANSLALQVRVIDLFREWDEDGDGEVDKFEFRKAMPMLGLHATKDHIDALFDSFDKVALLLSCSALL